MAAAAIPAALTSLLSAHGAHARALVPCGTEIVGLDVTCPLPPDVVSGLINEMARTGLVLFRNQGNQQNEYGIIGRYLTGDEQCRLSSYFGTLHSTHAVHPLSPNRDVFRLSNDPNQGFNQVGPEWHNDGSFLRNAFGHVTYHIIKAPEGPGNTNFAHLGMAHDALTDEERKRLRRCASVNSNGGVIHPLIHNHPRSSRPSLYLHTGMTGAIIERPLDPAAYSDIVSEGPLEGLRAWNHKEMDEFFTRFSDLLDSPELVYSHKWEEGDVIVIDNLAVAHKATKAAHQRETGLRILHRTTSESQYNLDAHPELGMPIQIPTQIPNPFHPDAVWVEGYVGFRWGKWDERATPH